MSYTPNINLMLTSAEDTTTTFKDWRVGMNGEGGNSNMSKIDAAISKKADYTTNNGFAAGNEYAAGEYCVTIGDNTETNDYSVAIGTRAEANFKDNVAIGNQAQASAKGSTAIGAHSFAGGYSSGEKDYTNSTVIGHSASAKDKQATAVGTNAIAGYNGVAIGYEAIAGTDAVQIGSGTNNTEDTLQFQDYRIVNYDGKKYLNDVGKLSDLSTNENSSIVEAVNEINNKSGRTATIVLAASNSSVKSKAAADYLCDGTDDQEEIVTAINALPETGGEIILLEGTYKLSGNITISKSNVVISGVGWGTKLESDNVDSHRSITISSCNNCIVRNFYGCAVSPSVSGKANALSSHNKIEGLNIYLPQSADASAGIQFMYAKFCLVSNCIVEGCTSGVNCSNATGITITNNIFLNSSGRGVLISSNSASIIVSLNVVWSENGLSTGIYINDSTCNHCIIDGNVCYHNSTNIYVNGSWNTITNNQTIQNSEQKSIHIAGSGTNNLISNNTITNTACTNDGGTTNMFANNK